jgi:hypothetical protein
MDYRKYLLNLILPWAPLFKMMNVSRNKSVDVLRGHLRDADAFRDHAGAGLL